jgi:hypothetical protein
VDIVENAGLTILWPVDNPTTVVVGLTALWYAPPHLVSGVLHLHEAEYLPFILRFRPSVDQVHKRLAIQSRGRRSAMLRYENQCDFARRFPQSSTLHNMSLPRFPQQTRVSNRVVCF